MDDHPTGTCSEQDCSQKAQHFVALDMGGGTTQTMAYCALHTSFYTAQGHTIVSKSEN